MWNIASSSSLNSMLLSPSSSSHYNSIQPHHKKDWWRLLFCFKTNHFEIVGRSASSRARGDTCFANLYRNHSMRSFEHRGIVFTHQVSELKVQRQSLMPGEREKETDTTFKGLLIGEHF
ncbi:uncharacterized protein LOC103489966 isoform X1 [Cucumis melo]|uniref:Uncharacterized protein LOC103489966 isoform X1 n=1 Tax=Cucumis melo TaxID=3656 RepID=A0A1S3BHN9_CUCME|nr:uncharacterized protein LOC103489966 isoform X1 [Cucumis melo]